MVHCIDDRDPQNLTGSVSLSIDLQHDSKTEERDAGSLEIDINIRPKLVETLLLLSESFQIVSFTASDQLYADAILDHIDPQNRIFSERLYRQHCVETEYGFIKDLRIIQNR
jgi:CTD small phosphatase-like protein 2